MSAGAIQTSDLLGHHARRLSLIWQVYRIRLAERGSLWGEYDLLQQTFVLLSFLVLDEKSETKNCSKYVLICGVGSNWLSTRWSPLTLVCSMGMLDTARSPFSCSMLSWNLALNSGSSKQGKAFRALKGASKPTAKYLRNGKGKEAR